MHAEIVKRLEEAGGPSRELDWEIAFAIGGWERKWSEDREAHRGGWYVRQGDNSFSHVSIADMPRYTSSLDAAVALTGRMLPGWAKGFDSGPKTTIAFVDPRDHADRMFGARYTAEAATPALAMLLALFRSLQEKGG